MTSTITSSAGLPRWKVIHDWLVSELDKFEYGSDFYTASELCERFQVSSITAVRSLNELASQGQIEKIQGRGTVVRRVTRKAMLWIVTPAQSTTRHYPADSVRSRLIQGMHDAGREQGLEIGLLNETHLPGLFPREDGLTGFVLLRPHKLELEKFLRKHKLPYVLLDTLARYKGRPQVQLDRVKAGYQATRHLLELGHRRIGWITGPVAQSNFRDRIKGYRQALHEAGIPFKWNLITETVPDAAGQLPAADCEQALDSLLQLRNPPTALIMGDDTRAIHVLHACRQRGIAVPAQLSVVGYPNMTESRLTTPALTVIDGCFEKVGAAAVQLLLEQIFQKQPRSTRSARQPMLVDPQLCVRSSTGPVPTADVPTND